MPTNLRNMLVALGVIAVVGISISLYVPDVGVTKQMLLDGADGGCVRKDVRIVLSGDEFCDGGGYCRKRIDVARCSEADGGFSVIIPRKYFGGFLPGAEFVSAPSTSTLPADGEADDAFDCACPKDSTCRYSDGGSAFPNGHNRLLAGTFSGAGCLPMPCTEVAGKSAMPRECL